MYIIVNQHLTYYLLRWAHLWPHDSLNPNHIRGNRIPPHFSSPESLYISHVDSFRVETKNSLNNKNYQSWGLVFSGRFWKQKVNKTTHQFNHIQPLWFQPTIGTQSFNTSFPRLWRQSRRRRRTCYWGGRRARCRWGRCCGHLGGCGLFWSFVSSDCSFPSTKSASPNQINDPQSTWVSVVPNIQLEGNCKHFAKVANGHSNVLTMACP